MRRLLIERGPDLALIGVALAIGASIVAAIAYSGGQGQAYDPLNHTVSSLGEWAVSELALVFNLALITGGVLIGLFMVGRYLIANDLGGRGFGVLGAIAGFAMAAVGVFAVDWLEPHILVALVAFLSILVTAVWFSVWAFRGGAPYPRPLAWFAVWIAIAMVLFLVVPAILQPDIGFEEEFTPTNPRPDILWNAALEWLVILSAWIWIALVAWVDRGRGVTGGAADRFLSGSSIVTLGLRAGVIPA